jgi:hypothetical protein
MATCEEMSVLPGIIGNAQKSVILTLPGSIQMPGSKPCLPGCDCAHHHRESKLDWSDQEARQEYGREYRAANREGLREKARAKYAANRETGRAAQRARYAADPEKHRQAAREYRASLPSGVKRTRDQAWRYGLPPGEFELRLAAQEGGCYLCSEPLDLEKKRGIHVDHDHSCCRGNRSCGKCIRGLACHACNTGIGAFGDDPDRMIRVAGRLAAANARVAAERTAKPVQAELFDINQAARRREESALWLLAKAWGVCSTASRRSRGTPPRTGCP